ncbi:MAG: aspartate aminotransferase family protein [Acidobacteriaceae bacterium]|nr:aspartate aminotransferase family protein [Acidobacteriaceae bacterium]
MSDSLKKEEGQMKLESIQAAEQKLMLQTYQRYPVLFVGGNGVYLRDEQGVDYLDLLSGIGVSALGYAHPAVEAAIVAQSKTLLHTSNLYYHEHTAELALRLTEISGMDRAFFCNSGTEAWEAALKLARAHAGVLRSEGKTIGTKFLAMDQGFHGRTIGAVSTTYKEKYRAPFAPVMPGVEFVRFNDVADLREKFSNEVCGICIEAVQGEGGVRPASQEFIAAARELCNSTGALLLADEIQSGLGRTGEWFAYQHYGIQPDVTTLAKPIANGLPMGAMLCTEEAARAITPGMHGTTFGGGPLVCAVAIAVIDTMKQTKLLEHVREVGGYFKQRLEWLKSRHECVAAVRGMGLMLGMEIASEELATRAASEMMQQHIIVNRTSETVLRFLPPFILERSHVDITIAALDKVFSGFTLKSSVLASAVLAGE